MTTFTTGTHSPRVSLVRQCKSLASLLREEFGVPFRCYDASTGELNWDVDSDDVRLAAPECTPDMIVLLARDSCRLVRTLDDGRFQLTLPLFDPEHPELLAVGALPALAHLRADRAKEHNRLEKWAKSVVERLRTGREVCRHTEKQAKADTFHQAWSSLLVLDRLFHRLRIHKDPAKYRKRILDAAAELLGVQSVCWVSPRGEEPVLGGTCLLSPWDMQQLTLTVARGMPRQNNGLLILNDVTGQSWSGRYPCISNLCLLALNDQRLNGWAIAINKQSTADDTTVKLAAGSQLTDPNLQKPLPRPASSVPFQQTDAAILTPFLSLLGLYTCSANRFHMLKELMVGLARSLTASIDAKDEYTYGHSERVARVAMEIAAELGLDDDEQHDVYLTGLLHDIGKIGVADSVLQKPAPLTAEETLQIQKHVVIGHKILSGLHPISHLLPGVLHHHERYDGTGYPEGLRGDAIPMLARIIAVADSYDAMTSSRPYRPGMSLEQAEQILADGAGVQWDPLVIQAFLKRRQRIHAIRQRGLGDSLQCALDGALREDQFDKTGSSLTAMTRA